MSSLLVQLAVISSWLSVATSQSPPGNDMRCDPSKPPPMEPMNCSAVPVSMPMQCATIGACCLPLTSKDRCCQQAPLRLCNSINVRTVCEDMCACEWVGGSCRVAAVSRVDAGAPLDVLTCCSDPSDLPTPMPPRPSPTPLPTPMQSDGCGDSQLPFFCSGRSASASVCTSGTNHCCDWFNGACCQVGPDALCDTAMLQRSDQLCSQFCQCRWDRSRSLCERNQAWNKVDSRACCVSNRIPSISSSPAPTPVRKCPTLGIAMQCPSRSSSTCNEASTCCFSSPGGCCQLTPSGHCSQMSAAQCPGLCACELRDDTCQAARAPSFNNTDTFRIECCGGMTTRAGTAASTDDGSTPPPNEIWVPIVATIGGLVLLAVVIGLVVCFVARQRANARVKSARLESAFTESSGGGHSSALTQRPSVGSVGSNEILTSSSGVAGYDKIPARSAPEFDSARVDNDGYDLVPVVDPERRASTYSAPPIALTQLALARENSGSDAALEHELEVRFSDLRLGKQLGEGAFAKVYRGELRGPRGRRQSARRQQGRLGSGAVSQRDLADARAAAARSRGGARRLLRAAASVHLCRVLLWRLARRLLARASHAAQAAAQVGRRRRGGCRAPAPAQRGAPRSRRAQSAAHVRERYQSGRLWPQQTHREGTPATPSRTSARCAGSPTSRWCAKSTRQCPTPGCLA